MKKQTKLSVQWFYDLLDRGECDIMDFKEQLSDKNIFGKSLSSFATNYEEMARDVVAFANKKGGFLFIGIKDSTKEINHEFCYNQKEIFKLIKQIQDRTNPQITLIPHSINIDGVNLLVLEIPFSNQLHCTSRSEYIVRCNDGNRAIAPHEISTMISEKGLLIFDAKDWRIRNWDDKERVRLLQDKIKLAHADSSFLKKDLSDFYDALSFTKEVNDEIFPTTTGLLLVGNNKALKELPYSEIKYVRYFEDGTYQPYEWRGNLIEIADACFAQLKSEIRKREVHFGLFHEWVEDYSEIVLRELLINAIVHRDYSRRQLIEIRKYPEYLEIESPGLFPDGVDETNYLRKTNARNPNIMDVFREIKYAEKAGSGLDKVFIDLLSKGKRLPEPTQTSTSVIFKVEAEIFSDKLMEMVLIYKQLVGIDMDMEKLLILNEIINKKKISLAQLKTNPYISNGLIERTLNDLMELKFVEVTGKTSGQKYILHKSRLTTIDDKINYSKQKVQERARQKEAILRYIDSVGSIDNKQARKLLELPDEKVSYVSRLFKDLLEKGVIEVISQKWNNQNVYRKK